MDEQTRYTTLDLPFYQAEIAPVLPPEVLDFHTHVWDAATWKFKPWEAKVEGGQYMVTDEKYAPAELVRDGARLFPDRAYKAVCFGSPHPAVDWPRDTAYVAAGGRAHGNLYPLMIAGRELNIPRADYARALDDGGFYGFKVFLNWYGDNYGEKTVEEMLGPEEMALADARRLVVLLHVPRRGRLADPVVAEGVRRLAGEYPGAQVVLAHCGRCYLPTEMQAAIASVRDLPNVFLDTAMVMDPVVVQIALNELGPSRVLFATDLPIALMRGRRVQVMDHWVDVVLDGYPRSAFRVPDDTIHATFMVWEIVLAIRWAAAMTGLSAADCHAVFYDNGMRLLKAVKRENVLS
jgi:hypothetical protein